MKTKDKFNSIFKEGSKAQEMGICLKKLIESHFNSIEENIMGGEKVKLALYSRNGKNNVLCGIQQGNLDSCLLYVHHAENINHERIKFSGKGKHAKRIKFSDQKEINEADILWLFGKVEENAPY